MDSLNIRRMFGPAWSKVVFNKVTVITWGSFTVVEIPGLSL